MGLLRIEIGGVSGRLRVKLLKVEFGRLDLE